MNVFLMLCVVGGMLLPSCSPRVPEAPAERSRPALALGIAFAPGSCLAGANNVAASLYVTDMGKVVRYASPADGEFDVTLVGDGGPPSPVEVRWLESGDVRPPAGLQALEHNAELRFESARAGACSVRVEFEPSRKARAGGLGPAETTLFLQEPPPTPPGF